MLGSEWNAKLCLLLSWRYLEITTVPFQDDRMTGYRRIQDLSNVKLMIVVAVQKLLYPLAEIPDPLSW
jgi:hypothetical protein